MKLDFIIPKFTVRYHKRDPFRIYAMGTTKNPNDDKFDHFIFTQIIQFKMLIWLSDQSLI